MSDYSKNINLKHPKVECGKTKESLPTQLSRRAGDVCDEVINEHKSKQTSNEVETPVTQVTPQSSTHNSDTSSESSSVNWSEKASASSSKSRTLSLKSEVWSPKSGFSSKSDTSSQNSETSSQKAGSSSQKADTSSKNADPSSQKLPSFSKHFTTQYGPFKPSPSQKNLRHHPPPEIPQELKQVSQEILQNAISAFTNMHIAHEICIDPAYRITPPEKIVTFESSINDMMKKAFWDIIDEDLARVPPRYKKILTVIDDLRETLLTLLLPHNGYIRVQIEDTLNTEEIKREIDRDSLDFRKYVDFIIDCLAKLCSPSRDKQVESIRLLEKPSEIFSSMFTVMELMQLDMANYLVCIFRPKILEQSVSYERIKFIQFLQIEHELNADPLVATRAWLKRHIVEGRNTATVIAKAFGELITDWKYDHVWPETLTLDAIRIADVARGVKRASYAGAMMLTVIEMSKPLFGETNGNLMPGLMRIELNKKFDVLLCEDHIVDPEKVADDVAACAEEGIKVAAEMLYEYERITMKNSDKCLIRRAVKSVLDHDHKVRKLLLSRIIQYVEETAYAEMKYNVPTAPGLNIIKSEVDNLVAQFSRISFHNRCCFNDIYADIIEDNCPLPQPEDDYLSNLEYEMYLDEKIQYRTASTMFPFKPHEIPCVPAAASTISKVKVELFNAKHVEDSLSVLLPPPTNSKQLTRLSDISLCPGRMGSNNTPNATDSSAKLDFWDPTKDFGSPRSWFSDDSWSLSANSSFNFCDGNYNRIEQIPIPHYNPIIDFIPIWEEEFKALLRKKDTRPFWGVDDMQKYRPYHPERPPLLEDIYHHDRERFYYPIQTLWNRPNPLIFGKFGDIYTFKHTYPYLFYNARDWELHKHLHLAYMKKKRAPSGMFIDEDDRYGTNWSKYFIHMFKKEGFIVAPTPREYDWPHNTNKMAGEMKKRNDRARAEYFVLHPELKTAEYDYLVEPDWVRELNKEAKKAVFGHAAKREASTLVVLKNRMKKYSDNIDCDVAPEDEECVVEVPSVPSVSMVPNIGSPFSSDCSCSGGVCSVGSCRSLPWDDDLRRRDN